MDRTAQNGHGARAVRGLTLLALLLGLLAMHGVAGTHHAPAAAAEPPAAGQAHDPPGAGPHHQAATAPAHPLSPLPAGPATRSCDRDCPGALVALCVAVLAAAAVWAIAVVLRPHRGGVPAQAVRAVGAPAAARAALPPPDPVRELCISRT